MRGVISAGERHSLPPDRLGRRLRFAIIASLLVNLLGWRAVAAMAKRPMYVAPRPVEISRVIIDKQGRKIEKKIHREEIKRHIARISKPTIAPKVKVAAYHVTTKPTPPEHSNVIVAKGNGPANEEPPVAPGGNAALGKPVEQTAEPEPVKPIVPVPEIDKPKPEPVKPAHEPVKPAPEPVKPAPEPVKPAPEPVKPAEPVHKGPTRDSEPDNQIKPEIPDELRHGTFKTFVRVKVEIDEEGKPTPILRTSSGNSEIDRRVLEALKKWRWKPALENGVAIKSTQLFKFEFLVE